MKVPSIESERLLLEPLSLRHASEKYVNWMNDPEVTKYLISGGNYTYELLEKYLNSVEEQPKYFWAVIRKDSGDHIGNIKIDPVFSDFRRAEYGILMGDRSSWGMGFARESTLRVLEFSFIDLNLNKITLGVAEANQRAFRMYNRMGFVVEGLLKQHAFREGKWHDSYRMAMFREDFLKKNDQ